jgi:hypothetical protein
METGVCVPLPSKLTSASAAIPALRSCLPSRCFVMDYSITICSDSELKQLFSFFVVFYSTFVIMYTNDQSYMPNDSVNIEKNIKTYLLNTCVFNLNPGNQVSPMTFFFKFNIISNVQLDLPSYLFPRGFLIYIMHFPYACHRSRPSSCEHHLLPLLFIPKSLIPLTIQSEVLLLSVCL